MAVLKKVGNNTWQIGNHTVNCRTSAKALVMRDYYARNHINTTTVHSLPLSEFKNHIMHIKALWKQLDLI